MKALLPLLLALLAVACEPKPTEEELEQQRLTEAAKTQATPKPGDWMWRKDRGNPLETKKP